MSAEPHDDPRWVRTRQALLTALLNLDEAALAQVSVGSLTRAAAVHRTSFYNHFTAIPEAATEALAVGMREILAEDEQARLAGTSPDQVAPETINRTLDWLSGHRGVYLLASDWRSPSGLRGVADIIRQQVRDYRSHFGGDQSSRTAEELAAEDIYVAAAVEGYYAAVLHGGLDVTRESASRQLYTLLPEWMRKPI